MRVVRERERVQHRAWVHEMLQHVEREHGADGPAGDERSEVVGERR